MPLKGDFLDRSDSGILRRMKRACPVFVAVALLAHGCGCGSGPSVGPDAGGDAQSVDDAESPADAGAPDDAETEVDAGTVADGGTECHWERFDEGLVGGRIDVVAFDPRVEGRAYAATGGRLYTSSDGGRSFSLLSKVPHAVLALAFPGDEPNVVIAGTASGLARSTDAGATWVFSLSGLRVAVVASHPTLPTRVYASVDSSGVWQSDDGGASFTYIGRDLPNGRVAGLVVSATSVTAVLERLSPGGASTNAIEVWRTSDGRSWTAVTSGSGRVGRLAGCDDGRHLVATVGSQLVRSEDSGATWTSLANGPSQPRVLDLAPTCNRLVVADWPAGVWLHHTAGAWEGPFATGMDEHLFEPSPVSLSIDPTDETKVLAGTVAGLFRSVDGGVTWGYVDGLGAVVPRSLTSSASRGRLWLTTWGTGVWRRDGLHGEWSQIEPSVFGSDYAFSCRSAPTDDDVVVAGVGPDLHAGDATFASVERYGAANVFDVLFRDGEPWLVATQRQGILRMTDGALVLSNGGLTRWMTSVGTFIDVRSLAGSADRILAGTNGGGLLDSQDEGAMWSAHPDFSANAVTRVFASETDPSVVLVALGGSGVYRSEDAGRAFTPWSDGLSSLNVSGLVEDPDGTWYVTTGSGVSARARGAANWSALEDCLPGSPSNPAFFEESGRHLVVTTATDGLYRLALDGDDE